MPGDKRTRVNYYSLSIAICHAFSTCDDYTEYFIATLQLHNWTAR